MSGHSKWSTIKRQKGAADIKRGQAFTKIANAITIAVRQGGNIADPESNFRLRLAIEKARAANMPKENIERAIVRGGGKHGSEVEEVIYEGFAPGGVSVIVEAATDNSQRTTSEIKNIFRNFGASFGQPGSAAYQFGNVGRIIVKKNSKSYDEIFECVAESGAKDLEEINDNVFVYADLSHLSKIRNKLEDLGFQVVSTELIRKPLITLTMENETEREKVINFLHKLEEFDDVQKVYSNLK